MSVFTDPGISLLSLNTIQIGLVFTHKAKHIFASNHANLTVFIHHIDPEHLTVH